MKKFKIKNRPKRKYEKRATVQTSFSLSRPIALGLPSIIVIIALVTTAFIAAQPTDRSFDVTLPTISVDTIAQAVQTIPTFFQFLGTIGHQILLLLNPQPIITLLTEELNAFAHQINIFIQILIFFASSTVQIAGIIGNGVLTKITVTSTTTAANLTVGGFFVFSMISKIILAIGAFFISIFHAINYGFDVLIQWLSWPFKVIGAFLKANQPFFDALARNFSNAFEVLKTGTQGLSDVAKASK